MENNLKGPLQLLPNRVRRSYTGGEQLEKWSGIAMPADGWKPEEWLASVVEARNSGPITDEGLSLIKTGQGQVRLLDLIEQDPTYYLGELHFKNYGSDIAVLTKLLDAAVRLSIQVHPTKEFSRHYFNSDYGKTEAWYFLGGRNIGGEAPHVYAGFKPGTTKTIWQKYFEDQNISGMLDVLHKFYVNEGDVVLIEGGLAHAIGAGCFLIEIQEPSDLTLRVERKNFQGADLPEMLIHQGIGFERMMDCFNYETLSKAEARKKYFKTPETVFSDRDDRVLSLISAKDTRCFSMQKVIVNSELLLHDNSFKTCIVISGSGFLETGGMQIAIKQGASFFLPAGLGSVKFICGQAGSLECILCYPPGHIISNYKVKEADH